MQMKLQNRPPIPDIGPIPTSQKPGPHSQYTPPGAISQYHNSSTLSTQSTPHYTSKRHITTSQLYHPINSIHSSLHLQAPYHNITILSPYQLNPYRSYHMSPRLPINVMYPHCDTPTSSISQNSQ
eukprot:1395501-Amorphochlora_amoeboformis.AAC.1